MQREKYEFQSLSTSVSNSPVKTERSVASLRGEKGDLIFVHLRTRVVCQTDFQDSAARNDAIAELDAINQSDRFSQDRRQLKRKRPKGKSEKSPRRNISKIKLWSQTKSKYLFFSLYY